MMPIISCLFDRIYWDRKTLYIGYFDLSKAFDIVSRVKLLQKLIKYGIGACMFEALRRIYAYSICITTFGKLSDSFDTFSDINQGAASSSSCFIKQ